MAHNVFFLQEVEFEAWNPFPHHMSGPERRQKLQVTSGNLRLLPSPSFWLHGGVELKVAHASQTDGKCPNFCHDYRNVFYYRCIFGAPSHCM